MGKQINKIRIYMVRVGDINKWFSDRDTAVLHNVCTMMHQLL